MLTHSAAAPGLPRIHSHWSQPPASPPGADSDLVALVERFELLLRDYIDAHLQWVSGARQARTEFALLKMPNCIYLSDGQRREQDEIFNRIRERTGCAAASTRMTALHDELEPLVVLIKKKVSTLAGLRARALVLLFESDACLCGLG